MSLPANSLEPEVKLITVKRFAIPVLLISSLIVTSGCNSEKPKSETPPAAPVVEKKSEAPAKPALTKLEIKDTVPGNGTPVAAPGCLVYLTYVGKLANGEEFDGSDKHDNAAFAFVLGKGGVIKGWDQGIVGMKIGGERDLAVPSKLAYGQNGPPGIPPNSDLYFHVKLWDVIPPADFDTVVTKDVKKGTGRAAKNGDQVSIHYTGTLVTGTKFDSSRDKGQPFEFKLGAHEVVPGFESGIVGMKVGGVRKLHIPPALGYGEGGRPPIPPNSVLNFDIELLAIK